MANYYNKKIPATVEYVGYYTDNTSLLVYSPEKNLLDMFDTEHILRLVNTENKLLCEYQLEKNRGCIGFNIHDGTIVYVNAFLFCGKF